MTINFADDYKLQNALDGVYYKTKCLKCGRLTRTSFIDEEYIAKYHRCRYCNSFKYERVDG